MIKLIITDMDGTLLNNNHEIDEEFWPLLERLKEKNILFAVASGRPYYNLAKKFENVKENMLFIAENGSLVISKENELFSSIISISDIKKIKDICKKISRIVPIYCAKDFAYIEKQYFVENKELINDEVAKYYNNMKIVEDIEEVDEKFIKVAICDSLGSETNSYPILKEYESIFQIVLSGKIWADISKLGTNKGVAIKEIQDKLNISYDETMAFGDYLNDLEMMKHCKYSYAMKNAHKDLIEVANFTTKEDNDNLGVINTIKEMICI